MDVYKKLLSGEMETNESNNDENVNVESCAFTIEQSQTTNMLAGFYLFENYLLIKRTTCQRP
jgi:hypothetical protein